MRTLALDVGTMRVGVAVSDPLRKTARPLTLLARSDIEGDAERLAKIVTEQQVDELVVGLPTTMRGEAGKAARDALGVASRLGRALNVPVVTWDERLTTVMAEASMVEAGTRRGKRKQKRDMVAAALILQSYLDSKSHGESSE